MVKTALVTGGARRLGRAVCECLARAGYRVVVHHHRARDEAASLVRALTEAGHQALTLEADLSARGAARELAQEAWSRLGRLHLLVNNASVYPRTPIDSLSEEAWDAILSINLRAPFFLAVELGRRMQRAGSGAVVNLLDAKAGLGRSQYAPYQASKAALESVTGSLARALAPEVRVNGVAPGAILLPEGAGEEEAERLRNRIPAGRFGRPQEVAEAVLFLAEGPEYVTGAVLPVDGGWRLV